jgi:formylmethanofuran dehydrogenase subunit E-like metal-binding protein
LRKQLSKEGALFEYEAFLLSRISNNFIHWNTLQKNGKLAILKRFKEELKQQLSSKWKANMVLYFDFDWWLDVQISRLA